MTHSPALTTAETRPIIVLDADFVLRDVPAAESLPSVRSDTRHSARSRLRNAVAALLLVAGMLLGWNSLPDQPVSATTTSAIGDFSELETIPISEIELGQRLPGTNLDRSQVDDSAADVDPATWRRIELQIPDFDGVELSISLLRPVEWIERLGVQPGGTVHLELEEMGIDGEARVLSVSECPPIEPGDGHVVTGKFVHLSSGNLLDVTLEGSEETIGVTAQHPFWSEDRQAYVPIGEMIPGELVRTEHGVRRIGKLLPQPRDELVYNLEVHREHVYLVGTAGTLVHNSCPKPRPLTDRPHGGSAHDTAIMEKASLLVDKGDDVVGFIRKNQTQVNALDDKVSNLRPDLQWTERLPDGSLQRYYYQVVGSNSNTRAMDLLYADPDAIVIIDMLRDTGKWLF